MEDLKTMPNQKTYLELTEQIIELRKKNEFLKCQNEDLKNYINNNIIKNSEIYLQSLNDEN